MVEVEAKKVILKNLAREYLVQITEPYTAGVWIKIEDNVISADIDKISSRVSEGQLQDKANIDADNANNFYRGNPYVNTIGNLLGFMKNSLINF